MLDLNELLGRWIKDVMAKRAEQPENGKPISDEMAAEIFQVMGPGHSINYINEVAGHPGMARNGFVIRAIQGADSNRLTLVWHKVS